MTLIQAGRVKVDGRIEKEPSRDVSGAEDIFVNGKRVLIQQYTYIMLHKPPGYTTTKEDVHAEKTVLDLLPKNLHHLWPVGRLDRDSEGLLLLSNDGPWTFGLTHPKFHLDKTYVVRVKGKLSSENKNKIEKGIIIDPSINPSGSLRVTPDKKDFPTGQKTAPCRISQVRYNDADTELQIIIHEGKKRQIRRMLWSVGHKVFFLKRISIGPLNLGPLTIGQWRQLTQEEVERLKKI